MTIVQTINAFLDDKAARSEHTRKTYQGGLNYFLRYLDEQGIRSDTPPDVLSIALAKGFNAWLAKQKWQKGNHGPINTLSMRSRQLYIRALLGYYEHLVISDLSSFTYSQYKILAEKLGKATKFDRPPINDKLPDDEIIQAILEQARKPPDLKDTYSDRECERRILGHRRNLAIVLCLYSGGMRVGELVKLRYRNMNHQHLELTVIGKGNKQRAVKVSEEAWQAVLDYLRLRDGRIIDRDAPLFARHDRNATELAAISTHSVNNVIYQLATLSGVFTRFNLTPHSFRHYFATKYLAYTGDLALTQDTLGHADPATTRIYAKTSDELRRQKHREMFDGEE